MLREDAADRLLAGQADDGYVFPDYGGYCFAHVPATGFSVLGSDLGRTLPDDVLSGVDTDVENVVVLFVDGFGWDAWVDRYRDHSLLSRLTDAGTVTPLTSIYPSETTACVSTFHTGQLPCEHGLLGWDGYVPELDTVVETLPFTLKGGEDITEAYPDLDPETVVDGESLYRRAADDGVASYVFEPFEEGPYERVVTDGSTRERYEGLDDLARRVRDAVTGSDDPTYVYGYVPNVDTAAHVAGTESTEYADALTSVCEAVEDGFVDAVDDETAAETMVLVTADHGEVDTDPETNVDLRDADFWDDLTTTGDGDAIPPVGGPRNVQLHVEPGANERVRATLERLVDGLVCSREEYLDRGLFGDCEPSERFLARSPDLLAIPQDKSVWYEEHALAYVGMHGGLHRAEALVPLAAARLDALQ